MKNMFVIGALVLASGGAWAESVINGNPFYHPGAGDFYNVFTPIEFNTKFERFVMRDEFGYGITDNVSIMLSTSGSYDSGDEPEFGKWAWNDLEIGVDWSLYHQDDIIAEVYGRGKQLYDTKDGLETIAYNWTVGARVGRMTDKWTVAGVVQVDYIKDDLAHYNHDAWAMSVGLQGQYLIDSDWNIIAGLMFDYDLFDKYYDEEQLDFKLGLNYNFDNSKYLGVYLSKDVIRSFDDAPMYVGVNFGLEF